MSRGAKRGMIVSVVVASISAHAGASSAMRSELPLTDPTAGAMAGNGLVTIDVTGIPSMDGAGSPHNVVMMIWVGPYNYITGVGWDVILETLVPGSRRRDIVMTARDTMNDPFSGFFIEPGGADPTPGGPSPYSSEGIRKLADFGIPNLQALGDGLIRIEFVEGRDDAPGLADALWVSGTVSLQTAFEIPPIPSPGSAGIIGAALAVCLRRIRR